MAAVRKGQVVVVTGASSGIGRAVAREFAKHDAKLILVARHRDKLEEVAGETGGMVRPADVNDARAMRAIAQEAVALFGRLDVWINNAGVIKPGDFLDVSAEEHRAVIETDLIGYVNGSHAALEVFVEQKRGVLIQNASVAARLVPPRMSSYVAAKFGVRELTHALRQDLMTAGLGDVHVCEINPGIVATPAIHDETLPFSLPKTTSERVAARIVRLSANPKRETFVGFGSRLGTAAYTLVPGLAAWVMRLATKFQTRVLPNTSA